MNEGIPDDDLVFLWKIIKKIFRWIAILIAVLFVYAVVFRSNTIVGWWKFYQLCKTEGGARFYEPVERNVGWLLEEKNRYPRYTPNLFSMRMVKTTGFSRSALAMIILLFAL